MEEYKIESIFNEAQVCKKCYGDIPIRVPRPDSRFGKAEIKVMFINERPGWKGAGASDRISPDNNDPTARQFKECFEQLGLSWHEIFSTNACICYADQEDLKNKVPSAAEISNCLFWLEKQIQALNPKLIISLGNIALKSLKLYFKDSVSLKKFSLKENVGDTIKDTVPWVYPLYHTSKRAQMARSVEEQKRGWLKVKDILSELDISK